MSKILTVFGATGNQGGSVISAVLADPVLSKEYKIRGVTRDASKPAAKALAGKGVELVSADLSSPETIRGAVEGAHSVFIVTNYWESGSAEVELAQGKAVADASKAAGVKHLIFSSLINVTEASNGALTHVKHFDAKATVEKYIREIGVPATFVMPGFYMSNLFDMIRKNEDGTFTWALPVDGDKAQVPVFDASGDTGLFVKAALKLSEPTGRQILAAAEYISPNQLIAEFSEVTGRKATFAQVPGDVFKSFLPPQIADEMNDNMLLLQDPGYYQGADLADSLQLLDAKPTTWKAFVEANKAKWE
ncbi:unnamed protein product [Clonostachys rosea f. rosea IK726]|uniref:NmrA-like family domain-containing protein 1 n=2 Tax=Bionectria ochroleuca TaxID=29856 RepID=A0A0B7K366_BIOOC|nr:unnamed protein product [Clonostachys rosea f. rosea IK726]